MCVWRSVAFSLCRCRVGSHFDVRSFLSFSVAAAPLRRFSSCSSFAYGPQTSRALHNGVPLCVRACIALFLLYCCAYICARHRVTPCRCRRCDTCRSSLSVRPRRVAMHLPPFPLSSLSSLFSRDFLVFLLVHFELCLRVLLLFTVSRSPCSRCARGNSRSPFS